MLGCYDFCGHFEWSHGWFERTGGHPLVRTYWYEALYLDELEPVRALIGREGFAGMAKYWGPTLLEESPSQGFVITQKPDVFRFEMHDCPSKGFLIRNGLENYRDYCDHCMGWIGPVLREAGFVIDHEHNHHGQCWWEMRKPDPSRDVAKPGETSGKHDARLLPHWNLPGTKIDRYVQASDPDDKQR